VVSAPLARRFFALGTTTSSLAICLVIGAATSAMAQADGAAIYAVTYLDVSMDWVLQGAGLIKQYHDRTPSASVLYLQRSATVHPISMSLRGSPMQVAVKALAAPSQKEAGALRYDIYEEPNPHLNHFSIVAAWTNEKAYEDHEAAPYMKQFRVEIAQTGKGNL